MDGATKKHDVYSFPLLAGQTVVFTIHNCICDFYAYAPGSTEDQPLEIIEHYTDNDGSLAQQYTAATGGTYYAWLTPTRNEVIYTFSVSNVGQ